MSAQADSSGLQQAFDYCLGVVRGHYENFPVASWLIPPERRPHIAAVYAFARAADDMADEGSLPVAERLRRLDAWETALERAYAGQADHPVFIALSETVARYGIPKQLLTDLLTAFRSDVGAQRFSSFDSLLGYCRHSANPIGRLVLLIFEDASDRTCALSDHICSGLQLANFWQDLSVDLPRNRLYLPLDDLERFGYTESNLRTRQPDPRIEELLRLLVSRTRALFEAGRPLLEEVSRTLRMEVVLSWRGGMAILDRVEREGAGVLQRRPTLSPVRKASILISALMRWRR